jgi:Na+-driven multidrug efflux pump
MYTFFLICVAVISREIFKLEIISFFTKSISVKEYALNVFWLIQLSIFPNIFKGMLRGMVVSLGI